MADETPPIDVESILAAAAHGLVKLGRQADANLLAIGDASIEEDGYDNWNGGTISWEVGITVPYPDYIALDETHRTELEKFINDVISPFLPEIGHWVHSKIKPAPFKDPNWRINVRDNLERQTPESASQRSDETRAFISYQTTDKRVAGAIQEALKEVGISSFLAHEDIEVSVEWRERILQELREASLFISLLSENYFASTWCVQESGIAAYRGITAIHLSLDGSIPKGFSGNVQSAKIDPERLSILELIPGIIQSNFDLGIGILINVIGSSRSFRGAEANFRLILPHLSKMNDGQTLRLLEICVRNSQIHHASLCASKYIPPILQSHGHLLPPGKREFLKGVLAEYE